jgi:hypothetical protein
MGLMGLATWALDIYSNRFNINLIEILNTLFEVEPLVIGPGGLTFDLVLHFIYILNFLCHSYQAMLSTGILKTFLKA